MIFDAAPYYPGDYLEDYDLSFDAATILCWVLGTAAILAIAITVIILLRRKKKCSTSR